MKQDALAAKNKEDLNMLSRVCDNIARMDLFLNKTSDI